MLEQVQIFLRSLEHCSTPLLSHPGLISLAVEGVWPEVSTGSALNHEKGTHVCTPTVVTLHKPRGDRPCPLKGILKLCFIAWSPTRASKYVCDSGLDCVAMDSKALVSISLPAFLLPTYPGPLSSPSFPLSVSLPSCFYFLELHFPHSIFVLPWADDLTCCCKFEALDLCRSLGCCRA